MFSSCLAQVAKRELALECDYRHELAAQARFRDLVANDPELNGVVDVPGTIPELSSPRVMTSEWVHGVPIDKVNCKLDLISYCLKSGGGDLVAACVLWISGLVYVPEMVPELMNSPCVIMNSEWVHVVLVSKLNLLDSGLS